MAYNITDACVKCGSCAEQCPVEAISEGEDSTSSTLMSAFPAALALTSAPSKLSRKANSSKHELGLRTRCAG